MKDPRLLVVALVALPSVALAQGSEEGDAFGTPKPPKAVVIPHPMPSAGARFGQSVAWLDFDGDGVEDLAVGAPGEGAVYVFSGPKLEEGRRYLPVKGEGSAFGHDLAAGQLDGKVGEELVISASNEAVGGAANSGRVFLLSHGDSAATALPIQGAEGALLGTSLAVGDYDGDGHKDVAAGAPKTLVGGEPSGSVVVHSLATGQTWRIDNPIGAWKHGNYGHDLATGDANGDGKDDLFVSALGNRTTAGIKGAGQVYVHLNPVPTGKAITVEDPAPAQRDGARFGMSIAAGDVNGDGKDDFLVGSPRKNGGGINDAGQGFLFFGGEFSGEKARILLHPNAIEDHLLGFRALAADVTGDANKDVLFACLGGAAERALLVWSGTDATAAPWILPAPTGGTGHFLQGLAAGRAAEGARQPLALGDINYDPGTGADTGRVVVWRFE